MKKIIFYICIAIVTSSCKNRQVSSSDNDVLPFFNTASFTPEWIEVGSKKYDAIHSIPEFSFMNQDGKVITQDFYRGKIYIADFFFVSCPGICPKLTKNMGILQEKYKSDDDILLLSHTVMPWKDSVPELKKYALKNEIDSNKWNLVTGERDEIYRIARNAYFADEDFVKTQDESAFIHTENFILIDKKGRIRGVYNGTLELETKRLMKHIEILKKGG